MKAARSHLVAAVTALTAVASAQGLTLDGQVLAGAGTTSAVGGTIELSGTLGESIVGFATSTSVFERAGFWSGFDARLPGTGIAGLRAIPGPAEVLLAWESDGRALLGYVVDRRTGAGPYLRVGSVPFAASGDYELLDLAPTPGTPHTWLVSEWRAGGLLVPRVTIDGAAYGTTLPPNVSRVGPGGSSDIQAAIAAAPPGAVEWLVSVRPGTWPAFTVDASAPARLRVIGDGTGRVAIDTSAGPVRILARGPGQTIELTDLEIGGASIPQTGLIVDGALGPVVLDRLRVSAAAGSVAVDVRNSPTVAIERSALSAGTGLHLDGARAAVMRSSTDGLDLDNGSRVTAAELANSGALSIDATSRFTPLPGAAPDLTTPVFAVPGVPAPLELRATPNASFSTFVSVGHGFLEFPPIELPLLMDLSLLLQLQSGTTDASGIARAQIVIGAASSSLLGRSLTFQSLTVDPVAGVFRMSTVTTKVWMQ